MVVAVVHPEQELPYSKLPVQVTPAGGEGEGEGGGGEGEGGDGGGGGEGEGGGGGGGGEGGEGGGGEGGTTLQSITVEAEPASALMTTRRPNTCSSSASEGFARATKVLAALWLKTSHDHDVVFGNPTTSRTSPLTCDVAFVARGTVAHSVTSG